MTSFKLVKSVSHCEVFGTSCSLIQRWSQSGKIGLKSEVQSPANAVLEVRSPAAFKSEPKCSSPVRTLDLNFGIGLQFKAGLEVHRVHSTTAWTKFAVLTLSRWLNTRNKTRREKFYLLPRFVEVKPTYSQRIWKVRANPCLILSWYEYNNDAFNTCIQQSRESKYFKFWQRSCLNHSATLSQGFGAPGILAVGPKKSQVQPHGYLAWSKPKSHAQAQATKPCSGQIKSLVNLPRHCLGFLPRIVVITPKQTRFYPIQCVWSVS